MKTITLYRSSAGSGKTYTLALEYLTLSLGDNPDAFRSILAITFTNKTSQEMKDRIVGCLTDFATGTENSMAPDLCARLSITPQELKLRSHRLLTAILHHYGWFSISTIDSFFQRIIRAFTRESGIIGNYRLESDNDYVLGEVVSRLFDEIGKDETLTKWMKSFANYNLNEGDNWNFSNSLKKFGNELFKEGFQRHEEQIMKTSRETHLRILQNLQETANAYMNQMVPRAKKAMEIIRSNGYDAEHFSYKDNGTAYGYFLTFSKGKYLTKKGARLQSQKSSPPSWLKKTPPIPKLASLIQSDLHPILLEMMAIDDQPYQTAMMVMQNFYSLGLLADITRKLADYKEENNVMMLSDASKFLNSIIKGQDTPFVYEKIGTRYQHYLIDEFQDTSILQWKNLVPLVRDASDQGNRNLIVGDGKQSIYRWRGGDLRLLEEGVESEFGADRIDSKILSTNYRSCKEIVQFNNAFFKEASRLIGEAVDDQLTGRIYSSVEQRTRSEKPGYVRIEGIMQDTDGDFDSLVLDRIPPLLEQLQDRGVGIHEIAILVRANWQGSRIAKHLHEYRNSDRAKPGYSYEVISAESLQMDQALSVNILVATMQYLHDDRDRVALAQLIYEYSGGVELDKRLATIKTEQVIDFVPEELIRDRYTLKRLSLYELTEELIRLFKLGEKKEELAYLQAFQDLILEFSAREKADLLSFLEWWELNRTRKSIRSSTSAPAASIHTLHTAKGLEFRYVLIPFCTWTISQEKSSMIWIESDREPYHELGSVPVRSGPDLEDTYFADNFREERARTALEALNMMYVAFTRAIEGLFVFYQRSKKDSLEIKSVGRALHNVLVQSFGMQGDVYEIGELPLKGTPRPQPVKVESMGVYQSVDWRQKLVIKRQGAEFFEDEPSNARSRINHGIILHTILAAIHTAKDAESAMLTYFSENALPPTEQEFIRQRIEAILKHPEASRWFTNQWKVRTEHLVLLPGGQVSRIDRVMEGKGETLIIDYKTGKPKKEDDEQMMHYAEVLTAMGYPSVSATLFYVNDMRSKEVVKRSSPGLFE